MELLPGEVGEILLVVAIGCTIFLTSDNESNRGLDSAAGIYPLVHLLDRNTSTGGFGGFSTKTQGSHPKGLFQTNRQVPILIPIIPVIGNRFAERKYERPVLISGGKCLINRIGHQPSKLTFTGSNPVARSLLDR